MKKAGIVVTIIVMILILTGGVLYWQYTHSPQYSLLQIEEAVAHHDLTAFEKYVDVDSVASRLLDALMQEMDENSIAAADSPGAQLGKSLIVLMKPRLVEMAREQIKKMVETGFDNVRNQESPAGIQNAFSGVFSLGVKPANVTVAYVKREGKVAVVGVATKAKESRKSPALDFKMRNRGSYWQLFEFSNFIAFQKGL